MWVDGSWNIENNRKVAGDKFRWGIAPVPAGPCGSNDVVYGWPDFIVISATTKHPKEAWEFAKFMAGEGLTIDMYLAGKIPSYKALTLSKDFDEIGKQPPEKGKVLRELAARKLMNSFTMGWSEWRGYGPAESMGLNGLIDAVLNGEMSFDEMLEKAKENINKVLERYYK
jgi:multiple sugar transport system substrate-binding protein